MCRFNRGFWLSALPAAQFFSFIMPAKAVNSAERPGRRTFRDFVATAARLYRIRGRAVRGPVHQISRILWPRRRAFEARFSNGIWSISDIRTDDSDEAIDTLRADGLSIFARSRSGPVSQNRKLGGASIRGVRNEHLRLGDKACGGTGPSCPKCPFVPSVPLSQVSLCPKCPALSRVGQRDSP